MPNIRDVVLHHTVMSDEVVSYVKGYLIYLRKSRADDPNETVEEILAKHETMLQEHALRELGGLIPEENIYREVVSGDSIAERTEIKTVLSRIEDPDILGVLVVEPQRLGRGDLGDCDKLISGFRFTHTLVVTPMMTYNLEKKMERRFFQDELLRGRDYLEYTKEILFRGRIAAVKRGCYIRNQAPFGYDRIKIGKDWTLEPNDRADVVRMIFDWYVKEKLSTGKIARRLNELGYRTDAGNEWVRDSVRCVINNIHYTGKVRYNYKKLTPVIENGVKVVKSVKQPEEEVVVAEGKHPAIIDQETFDAAQTRYRSNTSCRPDKELKNVLAGVLRCEKCGRSMGYVPSNPKRGNKPPRVKCYNGHPQHYPSAVYEEMVDAVIGTLETVELPSLRAKLENGDGNAATVQKRRIEKLVKQMTEYRDQEDKQYDLLETGQYTQELFNRRNKALREKMELCEKELHQARQSMPKNIDYEERIVSLEEAIDALKDPDMDNVVKNKLLREVVERIDYSATSNGHHHGPDVTLKVYLRLS